MKRISVLMTIALYFLYCSQAQAATDLGLGSLKSWLSGIGSVVGPIVFMISAIKIWRDKREGVEHLSGAVIGSFIFGASTAIFSLIMSWTK